MTLDLGVHPFYAPWFLAAATEIGVAAQTIEGLPGLPLQRSPWPGAFSAVVHPYGPLTLPRDWPADGAARLKAAGVRHLRLAMLPGDGGGEAFLSALMAAGYGVQRLSSHERALVQTGLDFAAYEAAALGAKRRKNLRNARNRLARLGSLSFESAGQGERREELLDIFRALEDDGWKGRKGTAFARQGPADRFLTRLAQTAPADSMSVHVLKLGDIPLAAGIVLHGKEAAWYWKTAYNEAYADYSPGVLFTLELTRHLIDHCGIRVIDSCATADHPMINALWSERLGLSDVVVSLNPSRFDPYPALLSASLRLRSGLKAIRRRLLALGHRARSALGAPRH